MKQYVLGDMKLIIGIENGVYFFADDSATGKTRMYYLLKDMMDDGQKVFAYSYSEYKTGYNLIETIKGKDIELLYLDRYNMYHSEELSHKLYEISKNAVVMLDSKLVLGGFPFPTYVCGLIYETEDELEVY